MLVVRGDPGVGKTALLDHLVESATGFTVVRATGVESEMELPFAALHQLCAPLLEHLETLPEPQHAAVSTAFGVAGGPSPDRLLIGLAVLNLLAATADEGPVLCVVDDAHWLDRESAQVLGFVARRLLAEQIGLVFATRYEIADLANLPELVVTGLREPDAQALLGTVLHVPVDERVRRRIVAETRGNPLALVEWPRGLTPAELAGGFGMPSSLSMSGRIEEQFRRQLAELPEPTQRFLTVAAAEPTGDPVIVWRAASSLGVEPPDASPAIDAGLLEIGVAVWFRHPLVRSAAYGASTLAERQAVHRALADAMDPDVDPDRRAWHRALGSPGPDEEVAQELERCAVRARARGGLAAAAALLERSVALTLDPARRADRILAAASAHLEAGSFDLCTRLLLLTEAAALDPLQRARADSLRARQAATGNGDDRDAPALYLSAARQFEPLDPDLASAAYLQAILAVVTTGNFTRGVDFSEVAGAVLAHRLAAEPSAVELLVTGLADILNDEPAVAAPLLREVLETTAEEHLDAEAFRSLAYAPSAAAVLWDSEALHRISTLHVAATRDSGALTMLPWALNAFARLLTLEGELDEAAALVAEADQIVRATGHSHLPWAAAILAGWRGEAGAQEPIDDLIANALAAGHALALKAALWASATLHNGTGQYERALSAGLKAYGQPWPWSSHHHFHELVEAAVRCGRANVAGAAIARLEETVAPSGSDWGAGLLARSRALLLDGADAEELYLEAIERLGRTRIRTELGRAHLLYGEWLRRQNRRVDAREQLRMAHELFTAMGLQAFADRARHELAATGEKVRKRSVDTIDELTPQEAHIAWLAADGRMNAEIGAQLFISPRTVEWHLRKVFTKLGVASRRELRDALPRLPPPPIMTS